MFYICIMFTCRNHNSNRHQILQVNMVHLPLFSFKVKKCNHWLLPLLDRELFDTSSVDGIHHLVVFAYTMKSSKMVSPCIPKY